MSNKKSSKKQSVKTTEQRPAKRPDGRPHGRKKIVSLAQYEAEAKGSASAADVGPTGGKITKSSTKVTAGTGKNVGERGATGGPGTAKAMSLLDAAAHILSLGTGDPMRCKDIVDLAVARSLWTLRTGKTPASTLYAAILREIAAKGDKARFRKASPGTFELTSASIAAHKAAGKDTR